MYLLFIGRKQTLNLSIVRVILSNIKQKNIKDFNIIRSFIPAWVLDVSR